MHAQPQHMDTRVLHDAVKPDPETGATTPTIVQSTAFAYETAESLEAVFSGREPGYVYSRIANPTVTQFERRITALEAAQGALACASGMAAISATALALAGTGDEIIAGNSLFGGTHSLFSRTLSRYGIVTRFVQATDANAYRKAITDRTRLIFVESIGNPKLDVPDLAAIAGVAHEHGVVFAVDNTLATPVLLRPKTIGANLVIHSTSKFINGHGHAIGGIIVDCGTFDWSSPRYAHLHPLHKRIGNLAFLSYLRSQVVRDLGCCLSPFNAFLMMIGVDTLAIRMERHCANAGQVAQFLAGHPRVDRVRYPGRPDHPDQALAQRQFGGRYGAVLTLELADRTSCFRFINGLKRARNLANIGEVRTLVIHPASTFCREMSVEDRAAVGVSDNLVRLSIGIEHPDDIISDLEQSLAMI
ncbi:MAG: acetyl-L-homoserine sulfhydrolase [Lentisphaerae bacterium RIFOXYC12_FULL_60_16]|nr:MAG: acetyl-L-homoserine sulfhydrolase [Lentisphaerae bacterium RIFOXYC12_FULL_60_16]OGV84908.1 MAG: acetyl-L-homoserine sulfhydrolase [Lentisphaerae bacterium RIFOXYB12_FULL_60_10]